MNKIGGIPGFENEPIEKQEEELRRMYKNVFSTAEGKIVLTTMLEDLKFFSPCHTDDERALNNYAKHLVNDRLGIVNSFNKTESLLKSGLTE